MSQRAAIIVALAEIVKHAVIANPEMFVYLEKNWEQALQLQENVIEKLVYDSVVIKSEIVNRDEKESGERKKLNFGHTFGHALEKSIGIPHGEAVSVGMMIAARLSVKKDYLTNKEFIRIEKLLENLTLPTKTEFDKVKMIDAIGKDKKRKGKNISFILLDGIGNAVIEEISIKDLEEIIRELY